VRGLRVKYRFFGCLLFGLLFYMPGFCFGQDVYNEQLNRGIRNNEPYSYILYKKAAGDPADARQLLSDAVKHSPDFPAVYFALRSIRQKFLVADRHLRPFLYKFPACLCFNCCGRHSHQTSHGYRTYKA